MQIDTREWLCQILKCIISLFLFIIFQTEGEESEAGIGGSAVHS